MIHFACAACRQPLQAPETGAGRPVRCPQCHAVTDAPADTTLTCPAPLTPPAEEPTVSAPGPVAYLFREGPPADTPAAACPAGYRILAELGRGGMGVVYQAVQESLNRVVALKMILAGGHAAASDLARFQTEAEAVARLQHPNVVQIYEVGVHDGLPYFTMEFCPGGALSDRLDGTPWPPAEAAGLVGPLAAAVDAAHRADILHRDLKPQNILLAADGTPKLTDFGLARRLDRAEHQTTTGAVMGTPSYMAPEQAAGRTRDLGPPADVYALGVILYELLTGRPPFRAATPVETLRDVIERDPAPVRLLNPNVDRDLEAICFKCLEKEPGRRYPDAGSLADDLAAYVRGEPVSVRSVNLLDRLARSLERSRLSAEFHAWSNLLFGWAAVILVTHLVIAFWAAPYLSKALNAAVYVVQFLLMGLVYWACGPRRLMPSSAAERQLWAIWTGYVIACFLLFPLCGWLFLGYPEFHWASYCFAALLTGLAFFALGGSHWGRYYAYGVAFFGVAVLLPLHLPAAPLWFGGLWTLALVDTGRHLRSLAGPQSAAGEASPGVASRGDHGGPAKP